MKGFDYTSDARWFVTICAHNKKCVLGRVVDEEVALSDVGRIVEECWLLIPEISPQVVLNEFIIMPNHIHGILEITEKPNACRGKALPCPYNDGWNDRNIAKQGKPIPGSLGTILGSFKSAVTKRVNKLHGIDGKPFWQRNYYEHAIRNDRDLHRIQHYIKQNPLRWENKLG